ncbi:hypothetical protein [Pseudomonas sp.]|uniref:hypothetical protein n=1 Tax=Pseudomonas sp. TaxID=306 RepID=UPI0028A6224B|nr:hypothetical protein [Pseudomonas sp.]
MTVSKESDLPAAVILASEIDWGVFVDAFLTDAAKVGVRYAAKVFGDRSGRTADGSTVVTPPVTFVCMNGTFKLFRSSCGGDHYVVVSEYNG